ncbi:MAG: hypothetical protein HOP08_16055 [Cyclobacteriaceae bacterium]|nr:hypothetical protein [Cyclobacteriaceae bacterium]
MNRILYLLGACGFLFLHHVAAQSTVQVMPLTGTATTQLPIATIKSGNIAAPVSLIYGSGFKVNDGEGTAGVGWMLNAGGAVRRELRGLPDDYVGSVSEDGYNTKNGWLHSDLAEHPYEFTPSADESFGDCTDEAADWAVLNGFGYTDDTEADIFSFNAPGLSGQFIFNKEKLVRTIPYQDLRIDVTRGTDGLISQVVITNNLGIQYTFSAGDKVTAQTYTWDIAPGSSVLNITTPFLQYLTPTTFYQSWYLTQMTSPSGGSISFGYGNDFLQHNPSFTRVSTLGSSVVDSTYVTVNKTTGKSLLTITGSNLTATFSWSGSVLNSVSVSDASYSQVERINLKYAYVRSSASQSTVTRNFLVGVYKDVNCKVYPGYKFEYHGVNTVNGTSDIPFNTDLKQDLLGYYNASGTSHVPDIYYTTEPAGDGEIYRIAPATDYSLMLSAASRGVDTSKVYYGNLKKMIFPEGGYNLITYESSDYYDSLTNSTILGGGPRVRKVKTTAGDGSQPFTIRYRYRLEDGTSSGQWTYRPMFVIRTLGYPAWSPDNLAPEERLLYSRVETLTDGKGKIVQEFRMPGMYPKLHSGDFQASYARIARVYPCVSLGSGNKNGYYHYPYVPNTNYDFERGLPKRVSFYTAGGKLVQRKLYQYQRTTLTAESVVSLRFDYGFIYTKYNVLCNVDKVVLSETTKIYDQISSDTTKAIQTVNAYTLSAAQMINKVDVTNSDGIVSTQLIKYAKDYASGGSDTQSTLIYGLVTNNQHGTPVEIVSKQDDVVTGGLLTIFSNSFGGGRILPAQQQALGSTASFSQSTVSGSAFVASSGYYPVRYFDEYSSAGLPVVQRDRSRNISSAVIGHNGTIPVLEISNALPSQLVFIDFEPGISGGPSYTGTLSTDAWSGKKSLSMTSSNSITKSSIARGTGVYYRFSAWVKGASNATVSVSINSGTANTVSYTSSGWKYIEKRIDMSAISSAFSFSLTSSATILIDNVLFYPETADVKVHALEPMNGETATMDSRGMTSFQEYDDMGRPSIIRNQDKDIVAIKKYHYKNPGLLIANSNFTFSPARNSIWRGTSVTFSIEESCLTGVTYAWYVDGAVQGSTSSTLVTSFTENKDYQVKLSATTSAGTSITEVTIHPLYRITSTFEILNGGIVSSNCGALSSDPREINAAITGCYDPDRTTLHWYYMVGATKYELVTINANNPLVIDLAAILSGGVSSAEIKCDIIARCYNHATGNYDVAEMVTVSETFYCE